MVLLDSDHLTVLKYRDTERCARLVTRLEASPDPVIGVTIANVEETMRGWLASIAKERQVARQVSSYKELADLFAFFNLYHVVPFGPDAAETFDRLRATNVRIGTSDL
jgi:tRNA(fMet)-specific endonuclease VapC